jgi:uncharacterized protein (TIGR02246 family)
MTGKSEAQTITRRWADRFNARDAAALAALYDPEAVLWGTLSSEIISTPQGVRSYFDAACASPMVLTVAFDDEMVRRCNDLILNAGSYTFAFVQDGQRQLFPARFSMALRKRDGQWLIVDHHSSAKPAPKKA